MKGWFASVVILIALSGGAVPTCDYVAIYESPDRPIPANQIDRLIKLSAQKPQPALCSDSVFIRRAYLDLLGKLPTAEEAAQFIRDTDLETKRGLLIEELLARHEYADYWSMRWGDTLRIKAEFPINLWPNAAQAYHRWVRAALVDNKPYDQFARELLTSSGSNFREGPVNFYRAIQNKTPEGITTAVALTFMGVRTDSWPKDKLAGMQAFFEQVGYKPTNEWKEENVFWDPLNTRLIKGNSAPGSAAVTTVVPFNLDAPAAAPAAEPMRATLPDGATLLLSGDRDPRALFADWLITDDNPWFARCEVNRLWAWLMGRGIIEEPDDIREDNPPSHPELLAWLENELVASHYDMQHIIRLIMNSKTYQRSSIAPADAPPFAYYPLRRLEAEVLIDAINEITGMTDLYTSAIPEPFTYIPSDMPAVAIADGSIISPFLVLFGRSARATGLFSERNNQTGPAQWRHMLNSSHIQDKIERGPAMRLILNKNAPPRTILDELYLTILSRYPTEEEADLCMAYGKFTKRPVLPHYTKEQIAKMDPKKRRAFFKKAKAAREKRAKQGKVQKGTISAERGKWNDIAWSLINSPEFLYRH